MENGEPFGSRKRREAPTVEQHIKDNWCRGRIHFNSLWDHYAFYIPFIRGICLNTAHGNRQRCCSADDILQGPLMKHMWNAWESQSEIKRFETPCRGITILKSKVSVLLRMTSSRQINGGPGPSVKVSYITVPYSSFPYPWVQMGKSCLGQRYSQFKNLTRSVSLFYFLLIFSLFFHSVLTSF